MFEAETSTFKTIELQCIHPIFSFVWVPLTLSHPTARSFCFLKLLVIKEQSSSVWRGSNPHSSTAGIFWNTCTDSLRKTLGQRHEALGEAQTKPGREQRWQSHRNWWVCAHTCVCVRLRTPDKFVQGSIWFVDHSLFTTLPRCFPGFGEQMIIGYTALE